MLHVDEGRLHAYLDGELEAVLPGAVAELEAHVAVCTACAARLADARRLREQSIDILRTAEVTGLRLPDFTGVEVEAPLRRDPVPNHRRVLQRRATALAWAASLVAALGIGWLARDLQIGRDATVAAREMEALAVAPVPTRAERDPAAEPLLGTGEPVHQESAARSHAVAAGEPASRVAMPRARATGDVPVPVASTDAAATGQPVAELARAGGAATARTEQPAGPPSATAAAAAPLIAQGRITTDAGLPVAGAQVSVPAFNVGTISRADGSYSLSIPQERLAGDSLGIRVQQIGYQPVSLRIAVNTAAEARADVELATETLALESVVVTATSAPTARAARPESGGTLARRAAAAPSALPAREPGANTYHPAPPARCSLVPIPGYRDPADTYFTVRARADTLLAGPGGTEYVQPPTRPQQARGGGLYGQLVEVGRVGGAGSEPVERVLRQRGSREVVVVPWGTEPSCQPAPWAASARWLPLGQPQFVRGRLRPAHFWVDGRPTFDLYAAGALPYPGEARSEVAALTAEQFFSFYAALPTADALRGDREGALEPLRRWQQQHPQLTRRFPAAEILSTLGEAPKR